MFYTVARSAFAIQKDGSNAIDIPIQKRALAGDQGRMIGPKLRVRHAYRGG